MIGAWSRTWWFALVGFALYFGLFLIPKVVPGFGATPFLFSLTLSLMLVVPLLVLLALWGTAALVISRVRKRPIGPRSKAAGQIALVGIAAFAAFMVLANVLPSQLPSGSYDRQFGREAWLDPESANHISGDITPRQKMLAEVVKKLPGLRRSEIENMLGPTLDTAYFQSTGRDLIYITGPERDSLFGIDSEWLLIWLDENGIYKRHAVVTD
jgi:hypothetical protein